MVWYHAAKTWGQADATLEILRTELWNPTFYPEASESSRRESVTSNVVSEAPVHEERLNGGQYKR